MAGGALTAPACAAAFPVPRPDPRELGHSSAPPWPRLAPRILPPGTATSSSHELFPMDPQEQTRPLAGQRVSPGAAAALGGGSEETARQQSHAKSTAASLLPPSLGHGHHGLGRDRQHFCSCWIQSLPCGTVQPPPAPAQGLPRSRTSPGRMLSHKTPASGPGVGLPAWRQAPPSHGPGCAAGTAPRHTPAAAPSCAELGTAGLQTCWTRPRTCA